MKLSHLIRRDPAAPSLRERAAALRDSLARAGRRPATEGEGDLSRRAIMGGALAAAVPLPALAAPITPPQAVPAPHPDAELLAAWDDYQLAIVAYDDASEANTAAWQAFRRALPAYPEELRLAEWEREAFTGVPHRPLGWVRVRLVHSMGDRWWRPDEYWTAAGLRKVMAGAVRVLGRGGQTPHHIRRWRGLLPTAEAFDALYAELEARHHCPERRAAKGAAEEARDAASARVFGLPATTAEGLAIKVRYVARNHTWRTMGASWTTLIQAAAAVSGVTLPAPEVDPDA